MTRHLFLQGDARVGLQIVPPGSVHCCVTSPPYFNQRDYRADGQIGLEETPADYVAALVEVCRGVWQALRDDGCFYLNVGDSHARKTYDDPLYGRITEGNLIGIPWMLAFALRREGFCLRMDNIWAKTKPKPSSVKNCTTPSHEYIFHLTKVPTGYYYDREAILEPLKHPGATGALFGGKKYPGNVPNATYSGNAYDPSALGGRNKWSVWTMPTANYAGSHTAVFPEALVRTCILAATFFRGCSARCFYCHNPHLQRGLKVAIHTNGAFPEHVPGLIGEVDKVSLDIKAAWEHYYDVTDLNCARHVQASLARYRDAYAAGTLPEFEVVHTVIRGHEADVPAVAAAAEGVDLVLQQGVLGWEPPLSLAELCAVADSLDRPVRIRTKEIGEVLYQDGVFTVAGSMTVTDPKRLQPYYKSGVPDGD